MPASILQGLLEVILGAIFEFGCYLVGRIVVPVVTLGRWHCDRLTTHVPRRKLRAAGLYHRRGGRVYVTPEATQLIGLATVILLMGGGVLAWQLWGE